MKIFTLCIDPERGKYLAVGPFADGIYTAVSDTSREAAVGILVANTPGIVVDAVKELSIPD